MSCNFMRLNMLILACFMMISSSMAEDVPPAVPVINVEVEQLDPVEPVKTQQKNTQKQQSEDVTARNQKPIPEKKPVKPDTKQDSQEPTETSETPETGNEITDEAVATVKTKPEKRLRPVVVVELFSSQACVFCPKADEFLGRLTAQENIIALSCHVDYFDVKTGSLSHPFCSARQAGYESTLRGGPKYTPQMVINGKYDAVGYQRKQVLKTIIRARKEKPLITPVLEQDQGAKTFTLTLPQQNDRMSKEERTKQGWESKTPALSDAAMKIYLLVFDKPNTLVVADGGNKGKEITYYNIVSNVGLLGGWNGDPRKLRFDPKLKPNSRGFAVLIHDNANGRIVGAAQYIKP